MRNRRTSLTDAEWGIETPREMGSPLPPDEGDRLAERDRAVKAAWAKVDGAGLRDEVGLLVESEVDSRETWARLPTTSAGIFSLSPGGTRGVVGDGNESTGFIAEAGSLDMKKAKGLEYKPQRLAAPLVGADGQRPVRLVTPRRMVLSLRGFVFAEGQRVPCPRCNGAYLEPAVSVREWQCGRCHAFARDRDVMMCVRPAATTDTQQPKVPRLLPVRDKAADRTAAFLDDRKKARAAKRERARAEARAALTPITEPVPEVSPEADAALARMRDRLLPDHQRAANHITDHMAGFTYPMASPGVVVVSSPLGEIHVEYCMREQPKARDLDDLVRDAVIGGWAAMRDANGDYIHVRRFPSPGCVPA